MGPTARLKREYKMTTRVVSGNAIAAEISKNRKNLQFKNVQSYKIERSTYK